MRPGIAILQSPEHSFVALWHPAPAGDTLPDLPVLAMAEIESRTLAVLDISERAAA